MIQQISGHLLNRVEEESDDDETGYRSGLPELWHK